MKETDVLQYISEKPRRTSDILKFGQRRYKNSAERVARRLGSKEWIVRMSKKEKYSKYGEIKEGVWKITNIGKKRLA